MSQGPAEASAQIAPSLGSCPRTQWELLRDLGVWGREWPTPISAPPEGEGLLGSLVCPWQMGELQLPLMGPFKVPRELEAGETTGCLFWATKQ